MKIEREITLKIDRSPYGGVERHHLNDNVTIITDTDVSVDGKLTLVLDAGLMITLEDGNTLVLLYNNIKDIKSASTNND